MAARRSPSSRSPPCAAFLAFARMPADILLLEDRPRRPARRHQRDRPAAADRADADLLRSHAVPRPYPGRHRRREGRHHEARRAGRRRTAAAGSRRRVRCQGEGAWCASSIATAMNGRSTLPAMRWPFAMPPASGAIRCRASPAAHQIDNAGTAIACLKYLSEFGVDDRGDQARPAGRELAGAAAAADQGPAGRGAAGGLGAVARRRPQCQRRRSSGADGRRLGEGIGQAAALSHQRLAQHPRSARPAAAAGALCRGSAHGDRAGRPQDPAGGSRRRIGAAGGHQGKTARPMSAPRSPISLRQARRPRAC